MPSSGDIGREYRPISCATESHSHPWARPGSSVEGTRGLPRGGDVIGDNGTRELVAPILTESEEHVDCVETQLHRIEKVGIENYLSEQMGEHDGWRPASRYCRSAS